MALNGVPKLFSIAPKVPDVFLPVAEVGVATTTHGAPEAGVAAGSWWLVVVCLLVGVYLGVRGKRVPFGPEGKLTAVKVIQRARVSEGVSLMVVEWFGEEDLLLACGRERVNVLGRRAKRPLAPAKRGRCGAGNRDAERESRGRGYLH